MPRCRRSPRDPASDTTEQWLYYDFGNELCPAVPYASLNPADKQKVRATINFFQLNFRPLLVRSRQNAIDMVIEALEADWRGDWRNAAS